MNLREAAEMALREMKEALRYMDLHADEYLEAMQQLRAALEAEHLTHAQRNVRAMAKALGNAVMKIDAEPTKHEIEDAAMSALDTQIAGNHYQMPIQPVEFITKNKLTFLEGCIVKRVCRHRNKNGKEDLLKAIHELQLMIELEYPSQLL